MMSARNNEQEFQESGENNEQVINAEAVEVNDSPRREEKIEEVRQPTNPLMSGTLNEKSYTESTFNVDPRLINVPIEEPIIAPPPPPPPKPTPAPPPPPPVNPKITDLPDKDKELAATRAAQMAIDAYVWLNAGASKLINISDRKLDKLHKQALIDLRFPVSYNGLQMTMHEFIHQFNDQTKDTFTVSETFKKEVFPLLVEVFKKKGVGMTTEEQLIYIVGKDIAGKAVLAFDALRQRKDMIDSLKNLTEVYRTRGAAPPPAQQAQPASPPPPPAPPEQPEYTPPAHEFNEKTDVIYEPAAPSTGLSTHEIAVVIPNEAPSSIPGEINAQKFNESIINPEGIGKTGDPRKPKTTTRSRKVK
jgi:hypothetical protein